MPNVTQNMTNRCQYLNISLNDLISKTNEKHGYVDKKTINKTLHELSEEQKSKNRKEYDKRKEEKYLQNSVINSFTDTESIFSPDIVTYDLCENDDHNRKNDKHILCLIDDVFLCKQIVCASLPYLWEDPFYPCVGRNYTSLQKIIYYYLSEHNDKSILSNIYSFQFDNVEKPLFDYLSFIRQIRVDNIFNIITHGIDYRIITCEYDLDKDWKTLVVPKTVLRLIFNYSKKITYFQLPNINKSDITNLIVKYTNLINHDSKHIRYIYLDTTRPSDLLKFNNLYGIALGYRKWNSSFCVSTNLQIFKQINSEYITNIRFRNVKFTNKEEEILDYFKSLKKLRCLSFINTNIDNVKTIYEKFKDSKTLVYLKIISCNLRYFVFTENFRDEIFNNENIENIIIGFDWKEENFLIDKRKSNKKFK
ncbi:16914_t:CDS:2, partial [Dentiscutata erythropus]